jgi:hypothetical protein
LQELRAGVALLTNAALERDGHATAVSHRSHRANGFAREANTYKRFGDQEDIAKTQATREQLHQDVHPRENERNLAAWQAQKTREHLGDLSREAMVENVRERFWIRDQSPAREQKRERVQAPTVQARTGESRTNQHERPLARIPVSAQGLLALLKRATRVIDKDAAGGSLHVRLSREKEQGQGVEW